GAAGKQRRFAAETRDAPPLHPPGTDGRIPANSGTSARSRPHDVLPIPIGNIWQCGRRDTRCKPQRMLPFPRVLGGSCGTSRARQLQDLINRRRARHVCGEYDVTSIESEDMDMSIRGKGILTTLAIALIGTTPAW